MALTRDPRPPLLKATCVHSGPAKSTEAGARAPGSLPCTLSIAAAPASPPPCHLTSKHAWGIAGLD